MVKEKGSKPRDLREIELSRLLETVSERKGDGERLRKNLGGLVKSIREHGVLEPIIARSTAGEPWRLQVVAGRRRLAAAKLAKLETIPTIVMDLTDEQAMAIEIVENLQREDVPPLDQARQIVALRDQRWSYEMIGSKIGRSATWTARRSSLTELSPKWCKAIERGEAVVSEWPPVLLEMVARLPKETQDDLFENHWLMDGVPRIDDLQTAFRRYARVLSTAPWKLTEADLVDGKPACDQCPKRSGAQPMLFEEADGGGKAVKGDRCLDPECWAAKAAAAVDVKFAELTEKYGKVVAIREYDRSDKYKGAAHLWEIDRVGKSAKGALPCLHVSGDRAGTWFWGIRRVVRASGEREPIKKPPSREARLKTRRMGHVARAVEAIVEKKIRDPKGIKDGPLLLLAAAFAARIYEIDAMRTIGRWTPEKLKTYLARESLRTLRASLRIHRGDTNEKGLAVVGKLLGIPLERLRTEAEKAIPVPKSWAKKGGKSGKAPKAK